MKVFNSNPNNLDIFNIGINCIKKRVNSNGSRNKFQIKPYVSISLFSKKLLFKKFNQAGTLKTGRKVIRCKGSTSVMNRSPRLNYSFKDTRLSFISSIIELPKFKKFISSVVLPSGVITYIPTTTVHKLFIFNTKLSKLQILKGFRSAIKLKPSLILNDFISMISSLPKNKPVSLLERVSGESIKYVRASGSKGKILKMDSRTGLGIIKLPSGYTKIFSIYAIGCEGSVLISNKKFYNSNKSGDYIRQGKKSITRGVAMNPVDHPHGGRTKAIKYPRTPWGTTAKKK